MTKVKRLVESSTNSSLPPYYLSYGNSVRRYNQGAMDFMAQFGEGLVIVLELGVREALLHLLPKDSIKIHSFKYYLNLIIMLRIRFIILFIFGDPRNIDNFLIISKYN